MADFVYFIKPKGQEGPVKIGKSCIPRERLLAMQSWSPVLLELAATAKGSNFEESWLHYKFDDTRSHGEWFHASDELTEVIDYASKTGELPEYIKWTSEERVHFMEGRIGRKKRSFAKITSNEVVLAQ